MFYELILLQSRSVEKKEFICCLDAFVNDGLLLYDGHCLQCLLVYKLHSAILVGLGFFYVRDNDSLLLYIQKCH